MVQTVTSEMLAALTARKRKFRGRIALGAGSGSCTGRLRTNDGGSPNIALTLDTPATAVIRWRFRFVTTNPGLEHTLVFSSASALVRFTQITGLLEIVDSGGVLGSFDASSIDFASGVYVAFEIDQDADMLRARIWHQSGSEPGTWQIEESSTDGSLDAIKLSLDADGDVWLDFDEIRVSLDGGSLELVDDFARGPLDDWGDSPHGEEWNMNTETSGSGTDPIVCGSVSKPALRISIDRTRRLAAAQMDVDFENEDGAKGYYTGTEFVPNATVQAFMWYENPANEVCVFTGIIDRVSEHRDPKTVSITARSRMKLLIEQVFIAIAPNDPAETGAVLTEENGVYANMEISEIVHAILTRGGWPLGDRDISTSPITLASFTIPDLTSWAEAITGPDRLAAVAGFDFWEDELGVIHFAPSPLTDESEPDPDYTFEAGVDIMALDHETDDVERKTRLKVMGPMTGLAAAWDQTWGTTVIDHPVGVWYDPTAPAELKVIDSLNRYLYRLRQSDRTIINRVLLADLDYYPLGLSGDPTDPTIFWVLVGNWVHGGNDNAKIKKYDASSHAVLDTYVLPDGQWTDIKSDGSALWLTRFDTDRLYKRDITDGSAINSWAYPGHTNPTGMYLDGTTIGLFFNGESRFRLIDTSDPGTITGTQSTAGTHILGGEIDTTTNTDLYAVAEAGSFGSTAGHVWKFSLATEVTSDVVAWATAADLEDELGAQSGIAARAHDLHPSEGDHPFEIRLLELNLKVVTSPAQALAVGQAALVAAQRLRRQLDVAWVGNPAVQINDVLEIVDPVSDLPNPWILDTYRAEMVGGGLYVGSGSLLPWESPTEVEGTIDDGGDDEVGGGDPGSGTPPPLGGYPDDTTLAWVEPPEIPDLPDLLVPVTDPTWGTTVTRISEDGVRHGYARRPVWNSDGSLLILAGQDPAPVLDGTTYAEVNPNIWPDLPGQATWSNTQPHWIYGTSGATLRAIDVTDSSEVYSESFPYDEVTIGDGEGTISNDDQRIVLMTDDGGTPGIIVVDVPTGAILADRTFSTRPDWAGISPLGNYVVAQWETEGSGAEEGTWRYDADLTNDLQITTGSEHSDFVLTAGGIEAWVTVIPRVTLYRLDTGALTYLLPDGSAYEGGHASGRHVELPGWVGVGGYYYNVGQPGADQIALVKTDGSGTMKVYCFGNHRGSPDPYEEQAQAVWSPEGTRVAFSSPWGTTGRYFVFVAQAS